jgi:radical SAM protein with 4Fe4S-binding SPASM domain
MKIPWYSRLRNKFESSTFWVPGVRILTQNKIFASLSYYLAKKRIHKFENNKIFGLGIENSCFCNAKCTFCPHEKMKREKIFMNMNVFNKLVERLKQEKINVRYVNMAGTGEPLMDKEIFKKIKIIKKEFPKAIMYLPTNFSLADKEMIEKIIESGLDNVTISLNADNEKDYKKLMGLDFKRTINNIENLIKIRKEKRSKLIITITLVANSTNRKSIDKFLNRWENKVDAIAINGEHSWAGAVDGDDKNRKWKQRFPCRTLFEQIIVHANGNIALCCVDCEGSVIGGNVMKNKIMDSFNNPDKNGKIKKMHLAGQINNIEMCRQCRFSERGMDWFT